MKTTTKVLIGGGILLVFLWFQIRPALIRRDCTQVVRRRADESEGLPILKANIIYRECLTTWGMKPEDLVSN